MSRGEILWAFTFHSSFSGNEELSPHLLNFHLKGTWAVALVLPSKLSNLQGGLNFAVKRATFNGCSLQNKVIEAPVTFGDLPYLLLLWKSSDYWSGIVFEDASVTFCITSPADDMWLTCGRHFLQTRQDVLMVSKLNTFLLLWKGNSYLTAE